VEKAAASINGKRRIEIPCCKEGNVGMRACRDSMSNLSEDFHRISVARGKPRLPRQAFVTGCFARSARTPE
jgi:hypothetical protein